MAFEITRVDVWAGEIEDRPGELARKLATLQRAGADLEFSIVRPVAKSGGRGVLFVAPLVGTEQTQAAEEAELAKADSLHVLRLVGPDRPGLLAGIAQTVANAGLNIDGLSAAAMAERCVIYLRFASDEAARKAAQVLTASLS
jgi:hypothetical protein